MLKAVYQHENIKIDIFEYHTNNIHSFHLLMSYKKFDIINFLHNQTSNKTNYFSLNWDYFDSLDCLGYINHLTEPDLKWISSKFQSYHIPWAHLLSCNLEHGSPELLEYIVKNATKWEFYDEHYEAIYEYLQTCSNRCRWIEKLLVNIDELKHFFVDPSIDAAW
jgi:hypothetical protein